MENRSLAFHSVQRSLAYLRSHREDLPGFQAAADLFPWYYSFLSACHLRACLLSAMKEKDD